MYKMPHLAVRNITSHPEHALLVVGDHEVHCPQDYTQLWASVFISELFIGYLLVETQIVWGMSVDNIQHLFFKNIVRGVFT